MLLNKTHNGCVGWAWLAGGRGLNATAISPIKITRLGFIQEAHKANSLQERTENAVPRRELSTAILPAKRTPRRPFLASPERHTPQHQPPAHLKALSEAGDPV